MMAVSQWRARAVAPLLHAPPCALGDAPDFRPYIHRLTTTFDSV